MNRLAMNDKGFTFIEIFIAMLILVVVMVTLFSSFKAFIFTSKSIKEDVGQSAIITNVSKRISLDLEAIYVPQPPKYKRPEFNTDPDPYRFSGTQDTLGQKVVSSLVFTSLAHAKFGQDQRGGIARIAYYLKENENELYDLYRSDSLWPYPEEIESCSDPILYKDLSGFEIIYKDDNADEFQNWDSDDEEYKFTFPKSIEFKITTGDPESEQVSVISIGLVTGRKPHE
ncbi:MAG: hypothetical protein GY699_01105 [Desulfobacteraceae bacterium]|nr:hypothetical protein [Desulfobacteraceae bacterium]